MQLISSHGGRLRTVAADELSAAPWAAGDAARCPRARFVTGLAALDALPPGGAFARGAVHELLFEQVPPLSVALLLARAAAGDAGAVIWCDRARELYPPAVTAGGIPPDRLYVLHPPALADEVWAVAECLRCRGVAACVARAGALSRVEARRLQLSAEHGGGAGLLLRPWGKMSANYAAATRWLVTPETGDPYVQRWRIQLIHGHGGRVGQSVILEYRRDTHDLRAHQDHPLRPAAPVAHRPGAAKIA